jgi:hypothetical protein
MYDRRSTTGMQKAVPPIAPLVAISGNNRCTIRQLVLVPIDYKSLCMAPVPAADAVQNFWCVADEISKRCLRRDVATGSISIRFQLRVSTHPKQKGGTRSWTIACVDTVARAFRLSVAWNGERMNPACMNTQGLSNRVWMDAQALVLQYTYILYIQN